MLPLSPLAEDPLAESAEYQAFQRFAGLTALKKELRARLNEIEAQLRALEPPLLTCFGAHGYQQVQVKGFLLAPRREPWVYPLVNINRRTVCEALKLSGLGRMVTENYSTRTLTKYVRELEEHYQLTRGEDPQALKQLLPAPLAEVIEVKPSFHLQVLDRRKTKPLPEPNDDTEENPEENPEEGDEAND